MSDSGLAKAAPYTAAASSAALRLVSYVFLRWIPGHPFPPIIWSLFAIYVPSFLYTLARSAPHNILEDDIHVIAKDPMDADSDLKDVDPRYVNGNGARDPGQELDVEETLVLEAKDAQPAKTLLTGLPSPSSLVWSATTFLINLALVAMVWDLIYRAPLFYPSHELSMARAGYVSDTTATVHIREPDESKYPIFLSYRHADSPLAPTGHAFDISWQSGGSIASLDSSTDYTGVLTISNLRPDTRYQYAAANHTGFFTTSPRSGHLSSRTKTQGTFTFLHSSCLKNHLPYSPFDHPLSNRGLKHLSSVLSTLKANFMLFLGDFIYIDVPRRLGASTVEDYRREYRQIYSSPDWPVASQDLPWIHVYDDHEIANDWDKNTTGYFSAANDPYQHYHIAANPPPHRKGETYFSFTSGPAAFFMLDTRRYRSPNDGTDGWDVNSKTMLGQTQLSDLLAWLKQPEPSGVRWKVVVSSVPFTKNWWYGYPLMNAQDTWRGYLGERQLILEAMWDVGASGAGIGVILLSGDRHEFAATAFPPPPSGKDFITGLDHTAGTGAQGFSLAGREQATLRTKRKTWPQSATVHEFSASPLNMFYLPLRTYAESTTSTASPTDPDFYVSDVCVKYIPDGNSKVGAIEMSSPATSDQSLLRYRLFVDGREKWSHTLTSPPVGRLGWGEGESIWG